MSKNLSPGKPIKTKLQTNKTLTPQTTAKKYN